MLKGKAKTDYQREYMRRRRAGQAAAKAKPAAQAAQSAQQPDRRDGAIAALKARIAELEAALTERDARIAALQAEVNRTRERPQPPPLPRTVEELKARKAERDAEVSAARKTKLAATRAAKAAAAAQEQPEQTIEEVRIDRDKWKDEAAKRNTRIRNLQHEIRALTETANQRVRMLLPQVLYKHILVALHPDRAPQNPKTQRLWTERAQEFAALPVKFTEQASP
jgi:hypothetical protein